ncbi:MAG: DNA methyltransferase [Pseudomonadota bacterium]|nr:DNA methyltransferase [Pseudomonadota bacterium]
MSKFNELVNKLREIFQIDRPELDFGVYRILNARADEINEYLEKRLKEKVEKSLARGNSANVNQLKDDLKKAEQAATDAGFDPTESPKVKELKAKIAQTSSGNAEHENAVFSHLLTFFSRYYDNGDFISQRRYKGDTYAIPYAGEEVMLHWANKDQYYIKSGENFSNYSFKLADGRVVHFRLVAADTAKDNRKDNDKERRFVLAEHKIIIRIDDEGEEYEDEILPVEEILKSDADGSAKKELIIRFEYKAMPKGSKQDKLVEAAVNLVLADGTVASRWLDLSKREPTEKNPKRTLLEKHLTNYTTKNTADYFIHKNLGKFLRGELDFYIKNEVMHLDDLQNAEAFSDIEKNLRMIQCLRSIALDLIKFLAQLEDFQKKLYVKKKFVLSPEYLITVDNIPECFLPDVLSNKKQWEEWKRLGLWNRSIPGSKEDLIAKQGFIVDTRLFENKWKYSLISQIKDLDDSIDAVLINADNYHALNLIKARYLNAVDCIHIDPPYNTDTSGFLYKNSFKHSSWLTMMESRLILAKEILSDGGDFICHIDENEYECLDLLFSECGYLDHGTQVWDKKNPMLGRKGIATQHEYICFKGNQERIINGRSAAIELMQDFLANLLKECNEAVNDVVREKYRRWLAKQETFTGGDKAYKYIDDQGRIYRLVAMGAPEKRTDPKFFIPLIHPKTGKECPVPPNGWSRSPETLQHLLNEGLIVFGADEKNQPQKVVHLRTDAQKQVTSVLSDGKSGKANLDEFGLSFPYGHPVSMYESLLSTRNKPSYFMDFFAGSGTNGHAVINVMRSQGIKHKQILVEMGGHFDDVLVPRISKAIYSDRWKDGIAQHANGISYIAKVLKLESYEDALNNLELKQPKVDLFDNNPELKDDYLLNYMLDVESCGSLLSTDDFKKPFDYTMKIAVESAGAFEEQKVDLVETFNYLIGLTVKHINAQHERGFVTLTGILPSGETCLVLWRDCERIDYEGLNKLCDKLALNPADNEFDVIYINGDHNIPTVLTQTAEEGGNTRVLKLRQIEPEFLERMFAEEDV